jgi:hypothetical protein
MKNGFVFTDSTPVAMRLGGTQEREQLSHHHLTVWERLRASAAEEPVQRAREQERVV